MQKVPIPNEAPTVTAPAALFFDIVDEELLPEPVPVVEPGDEAPVAEAKILEQVLATAAGFTDTAFPAKLQA